MLGKSDVTETHKLICSLKYKIKNFFKKALYWNRSKIGVPANLQASLPGCEKFVNENFIFPDIIIQNFDTFAKKTVEDIIIPRSDIIAVSYDSSLKDISETIVKYGHTRTLVYKDNLDNVIGFLHIKDLFEVIAKSRKYNLKNLIRKHIVSPHSMSLVDLLKEMQIHHTHITVVVDEYGGTDGIVTIENIIESIIGRINDEHHNSLNRANIKIVKPGILIVSARLGIHQLERSLNIKLVKKEEIEFDTIGGLVLAKVGTVPNKGSVIPLTEQVTVEVMDATPRSIKQLKIICKKNKNYKA